MTQTPLPAQATQEVQSSAPSASPLTPAPHTSILPVLAWLTCAMFFFYAWVLRVSPSVIVNDLMREFSVGGAVLGNLSALYFYGYAGMQIPVGILLDRFGPRRLTTISALLCACGCMLFATSPTLAGVALGRFIIGASAAFSLVGALAVAGQSFPARRFALLSGLAMMIGMAGGIAGQAPVSLAVSAIGWRATVLIMSSAGVLIALSAWLTVRDKPRDSATSHKVLASLGQVLSNRQTWLSAFSGLGATGPILGFAGLWGVPFLASAYELDRAPAAGLTSIMILGVGVGAPIAGWVSDRIGRRKPPLIAGLTLCLLALTVLIHMPNLPLWGVAVLCLLVGLGSSAQIINYATARESNQAHLSGTAIGIVNALFTGAGALFQPLIGWILDSVWNGRIEAGVRIYSVANYQFALSVLIAGTLLGLVCSVLVRETYCKGLEA